MTCPKHFVLKKSELMEPCFIDGQDWLHFPLARWMRVAAGAFSELQSQQDKGRGPEQSTPSRCLSVLMQLAHAEVADIPANAAAVVAVVQAVAGALQCTLEPEQTALCCSQVQSCITGALFSSRLEAVFDLSCRHPGIGR